MWPLESLLALAGSGVGAVIAIPLVWPGRRLPLEIRLLGGLLLGLAAGSAAISAKLTGFWFSVVAADHLINTIGLLCYPFLVVLAWSMRTGGMWPARAYVLWLPAVAYVGTLLLRGSSAPVPFLAVLPVILVYSVLSLVFWLRTPETSTTPERVVPLEWLLAFAGVLNASQIARYILRGIPAARGLLPLVAAAGFVAAVLFVTDRMLRWRPPTRRGRERSDLERTDAALLLSRINSALEGNRLFVDPALSLAGLAAAVEATPHQVSTAINEEGGTTYHDLVNRCRVAEAKALLLDPANDRFTIEGIGLSAGFRSRSAFYDAFRRHEGVPPTVFRDRARRVR